MAGNREFSTPKDALAHYGKKGMKWGVRNDEDISNPTSSKTNSSNSAQGSSSVEDEGPRSRLSAKKVALGIGILTVAGGAAYAGYQINKNGGLKPSESPSTSQKGKEAAEKVLQEPTSVILGTRGVYQGYRFLKSGGVDEAFVEWERSGARSNGQTPFTRYGKNNEKIVADFKDPKGRKDHAGRVVTHSVIVPGSMSQGINNTEDVINKIWPMLENDYNKFYEESKNKGY